jgi:hypothetical protein
VAPQRCERNELEVPSYSRNIGWLVILVEGRFDAGHCWPAPSTGGNSRDPRARVKIISLCVEQDLCGLCRIMASRLEQRGNVGEANFVGHLRSVSAVGRGSPSGCKLVMADGASGCAHQAKWHGEADQRPDKANSMRRKASGRSSSLEVGILDLEPIPTAQRRPPLADL